MRPCFLSGWSRALRRCAAIFSWFASLTSPLSAWKFWSPTEIYHPPLRPRFLKLRVRLDGRRISYHYSSTLRRPKLPPVPSFLDPTRPVSVSEHSHPHTTLWIIVEVHMPNNHTPRPWSRVALFKVVVIIPHQLTIRFRHDRLLRTRVHRSSAVEMKPRVVYRCWDVGFMRNEELKQQVGRSATTQKKRGVIRLLTVSGYVTGRLNLIDKDFRMRDTPRPLTIA